MNQDGTSALAAHLVPTRWILACLAALFVAAQACAQTTHMIAARNFAADARLAAQHKIPLLVLFSEAGCPWCERARQEFLLPMQRNPEYKAKVLMREVGTDSSDALVDFTGNKTTQAEFARRQGVLMMPTVMLLGPRGEALAEPLMGFGGADYYGYFLDQRIDAALARLRDTR
jgi:thioredoxin-related protein